MSPIIKSKYRLDLANWYEVVLVIVLIDIEVLPLTTALKFIVYFLLQIEEAMLFNIFIVRDPFFGLCFFLEYPQIFFNQNIS